MRPDLKTALREKALLGVAWSGVHRWGAQAISTVVFILLARLLTPEDFGLVALASVFIAFVEVIVNQGFNQAIIQRDALEPEHADSALWVSLSLGTVLSAVVALAAPLLAHAYQEPQLTPIMRWLSLFFVLSALSGVQDGLLQRDFAYKKLALRHLIGLAVGGTVGVSMALLGYGVWSLVAQQLITRGVATAALWALSDWRPQLSFSSQHFRDLFAFEMNEMGSRVLYFFVRRSDDLLISAFLGATALGFYSVAYRTVRIMTELFASTLVSVAFSLFSRLQHDKVELRRSFLNGTRLSSLFALPAFVGLGIVAPEFVRVVLGDQWLRSVPVLQVLLVVGALQSTALLYSNIVYKAMGKPSWVLGLMALAAVGNVVGFLIAVRYGIIAVAVAYVIRSYLTAPLAIYLVRKLIDLDYGEYLRQFKMPLLGSAVMVGVLLFVKWLLPPVGAALELGICALLGAGVYIAAIRLFAPNLFTYALGLANQTLTKVWTRRVSA